MKSYLSARSLLREIGCVLDNHRPSFYESPLEQVTELLTEGRHYSWVGIYLNLGERPSWPLQEAGHHPAHLALPGTVKKILISMKLAGRELGYLAVESDRESSFGSEDRVLLERVAGVLARFLSGPGKYLVRNARKPGAHPEAAAA